MRSRTASGIPNDTVSGSERFGSWISCVKSGGFRTTLRASFEGSGLMRGQWGAGIGGFRTTLCASFGGAESNCRHHDFQSCALPTELPWQGLDSIQRDGVGGGGDDAFGVAAWVVKPLDAMGCWHGGIPNDALCVVRGSLPLSRCATAPPRGERFGRGSCGRQRGSAWGPCCGGVGSLPLVCSRWLGSCWLLSRTGCGRPVPPGPRRP